MTPYHAHALPTVPFSIPHTPYIFYHNQPLHHKKQYSATHFVTILLEYESTTTIDKSDSSSL